MKKIWLLGVLTVFAGCNAANAANWTTTYHDVVRVHGHKRSSAAFHDDMRFCAQQTGLPYNNAANDLAIDQPDPPAFKACMLGRGLRWQSTVRNRQAPVYVRRSVPDSEPYSPSVDNGPAPVLSIARCVSLAPSWSAE